MKIIKTKKHKKILYICLILAITLIAGGSFYYFGFHQKNQDPTNNSQTTPEETENKKDSENTSQQNNTKESNKELEEVKESTPQYEGETEESTPPNYTNEDPTNEGFRIPEE